MDVMERAGVQPPSKKRKVSSPVSSLALPPLNKVEKKAEKKRDGYHGGGIKVVEKRDGIVISIPRLVLPKGHKYRDSHTERERPRRGRGRPRLDSGAGWTRCLALNQPELTDIAQHKEQCPYM